MIVIKTEETYSKIINNIIRILEISIVKAGEKLSQNVYNEALNIAPNKSGNLRSLIGLRGSGTPGSIPYEFRIISEAPYSWWAEEGINAPKVKQPYGRVGNGVQNSTFEGYRYMQGAFYYAKMNALVIIKQELKNNLGV